MISCEAIGYYKPDPRVPIGRPQSGWLSSPSDMLMVACHNFDLDAAGVRIPDRVRPPAAGMGSWRPPDPNPHPDCDVVVDTFTELALRCGPSIAEFRLPAANRSASTGPLSRVVLSIGSTEIDMFYAKMSRTRAASWCSLDWPDARLRGDEPGAASGMAVGIGVLGAVLAMTGLAGFCPMCAMVGRKLDKDFEHACGRPLHARAGSADRGPGRHLTPASRCQDDARRYARRHCHVSDVDDAGNP